MRRDWLDSNELIEAIGEEYLRCDVGICCVCPMQIVGLSLPYAEVVSDRQMNSLRERVKSTGWNDPHPNGLHLYLMPEGDYLVNSGGNHRAVLANELKLCEIKASVTVVVPRLSVDRDLLGLIDDLESQNSQLRQCIGIEKKAGNLDIIEKLGKRTDKIQCQLNDIYKDIGLKFSQSNLVDN